MKHTKLWNWIIINRNFILIGLIFFIIFELLEHHFAGATILGVFGFILYSHLLCCLLPLGIFHLIHRQKNKCDCSIKHNA